MATETDNLSQPLQMKFPKKERLCGKVSVEKVFSSGKKARTGLLKCHYLPSGLDYSRILVSVPKKLHKRAVVRNLLKRRIRQAWRLGKAGAPSGLDIAIVYTSAEVAPYSTIEAEIRELTGKLA